MGSGSKHTKMKTIISALSPGHRLAIGAISLLLLLLLLLPGERASASRGSEPLEPLQVGVRYPLTLSLDNLASEAPAAEATPELKPQSMTVKPGDSLALLFQRAGFSARTLYEIDSLGGDARTLRNIHPGDTLRFFSDTAGNLVSLHYPINLTRTLIIDKQDDGYQVRLDSREPESRIRFAHADITSNFWNAGIEAGLDANQIMDLAGIFGWDIDFALDIRDGDQFAVLFEQRYLEGDYIGPGVILAASFTNQGETYRAVRHSDGNYYAPDGRAMKKAFLRAPVNFKYISSNFNPRRLHPVTGKVRPHNGIDYAAPVGTPIMASGAGTVIASAYNKYNGNYVFIKHSNTYVTKYLHLKKRKVNKGQKVKQGQQIGTLGATGRVTGPHLHYEFLVHGVHKNPRTVKLPQSESLDGDDKRRFMKSAEALLTRLDKTNQLMLSLK